MPASASTATTREARRLRATRNRRAVDPRDAARAREGRRGRRPHRVGSRTCRRSLTAVDAVARFRARLRRRRRHDGAGRPSHRYGVEWANYYTPRPWLIFDADVSCRTRTSRTSTRSANHIPGAVGTVVSAGATVDSLHNIFGSLRLAVFRSPPADRRRLGPVEGHEPRQSRRRVQALEERALALDVFNLFDARTATSTTTTPHGCRANRSAASTTSTSIRRCRARRACIWWSASNPKNALQIECSADL